MTVAVGLRPGNATTIQVLCWQTARSHVICAVLAVNKTVVRQTHLSIVLSGRQHRYQSMRGLKLKQHTLLTQKIRSSSEYMPKI